MRIFFYPTLKPLGHPHPSGDLVIAAGLFDHLSRNGHDIRKAGSVRARWIYWKPWQWPRVLRDRQKITRLAKRHRPDLWFTYHTYYKAPDLLGPFARRRLNIPYVIFEASYSTAKQRQLKTKPGFHLNRRALLAADHVFTNRREDHLNLGRLLPPERLSYVAPGIHPHEFTPDPEARSRLRRQWNVGDSPVIVTTAMLRPGVKAKGVAWVIRACGRLARQGLDFKLIIAGDGRQRHTLERLAEREISGRARFLGLVPRKSLSGVYSAGDVFAFPGFDESLGLVYLEAQSCGLPVAALKDGGVPEVVSHGQTGLLSPLGDFDGYCHNLARLLVDRDLNRAMGRAGRDRVRQFHDLEKNYQAVHKVLKGLVTK